jgi:GT2 family glycosyltransferase
MTIAPVTQPAARRETTSLRASIILVNYNGGDELVACLASLYADPHCRDYEVILVDNGSHDGSARRAARQFPHLTVLPSEENLGFGGANNLAAQYAAGPVLAFLNPDTVVQPGWLQALLQALQSDPRAGLTLCRGLNQPANAYDAPAEVSAVSGAAFAVRRDLFRQLDGFDASYFMYFEDTDLSLRARLAGHRCLYVPQSVVRHHYRLHFGPQKTYYEERNRYVTLLKLYRPSTLLLLLPALLLAELITWGFVLLRDRPHWRNKLRAYRALWRQRRAILAVRRRVQATRRCTDRALLQNSTHRLAFEQTGAGLVARLAHLLFDPLFALQRRLLLAFLPALEKRR